MCVIKLIRNKPYGWVARDKNDDLHLYDLMPKKDDDEPEWVIDMGCNYKKIIDPDHLFDDVTWDSDPLPLYLSRELHSNNAYNVRAK